MNNKATVLLSMNEQVSQSDDDDEKDAVALLRDDLPKKKRHSLAEKASSHLPGFIRCYGN